MHIPRTLFNSLLPVCLIVIFIAGCNSVVSNQIYEDTNTGIRLEKPRNWEIGFHERSGTLTLERNRKNASARVVMYGTACNHETRISPTELINANIERIRILYKLDSIGLQQEPSYVEIDNYEVTKVVIAIPTMSLEEHAYINQFGEREPNLYQTIEMFDIRNSDRNYILVYMYPGADEGLNAEAQEIVRSIQFVCSQEP